MDENSKDSFDSFEDVLSPRKRRPQRTVLSEITDASFEEPSIKRRRDENAEVPLKRRSPALRAETHTAEPTFPKLLSSNVVSLNVQSTSLENGQLILQCINERNEFSFVYLQEQWVETPVNIGNTIRIFDAKRWGENDWIVDGDQGMIIVEPDTLISATSVAQALFCARKTVLNERFRGGNSSNKAMLMGSIIHELFQKALLAPPSTVSLDWLLSEWRTLIEENPSYLVALVALNFSPSAFQSELQPYIEIICQWVKEKIDHRNPLPSGSKIVSVVDIEENIWIPSLGLKGKLDATLNVKNVSGISYLEPLELKTGKSALSIEHNLQVLLYCVMLATRDELTVNAASLLYLKDGVSRCVTPKLADLKGAFQVRNRLATFSSKIDTHFPEPISENRWCSRCDHALTCSLSKFDTQTVSEEFQKLSTLMTAHLSEAQKQYFEKWTRMLTLEWKTALSRAPNLASVWKNSPQERETRGSCISNLQINKCEKGQNDKYKILLTRTNKILHEGISRGDTVVISTRNRYAIITGSVSSIDDSSVTVSSDHSLSKLKDDDTFHIDKLESMATHAMSLASVASFMSNDAERTKLRQLIVDLEEPQFEKIPKSMVEKVAPLIKALNKEQARAVIKALVAKDYALIEGLPGAGKSTTLSCVVRCFLKLGQTVLVTSHTHSAVDNLFEKFMDDVVEEDSLRIGNMYNVKDKVAHLTIESKLAKIKGDRFDALKNILNSAKVVGATCLSIGSHPLFSFRRFDVCLVDEASLAVECSLLNPLSVCSKFVLVGDAKQLAPLVQSREAKELGMNVSLFEKLQKHRSALTSLNSQYRMNEKIAALSSKLFYSGELICANETIAKGCVQINSSSEPSRLYSPELEHAVIFLDTNSEHSQEAQMSSQKGSSATYNNYEATMINRICNKFVQLGVDPADIGVICTYRKQVDVMREQLDYDRVEVNTVDQYQGRDKSIIIWSLVWTNSDSRCELLRDERRVNVALTRAKHKLILVGCHSSMRIVSPIMGRLLELIPSSDVISVDSV